MKNIILVENYRLNQKRAFSNLKKALKEFNIDYFKAYKKLRKTGAYRDDNDNVITKLEVE